MSKIKYSLSSSNELTKRAGEVLAETFSLKGQGEVLKEQFGITFKEDVDTTTAAGAYTTLLSSTMYYAAVQNIQELLGLVNVNEDMKRGGGFGAYKIPRLQPTTAYEVSEGAVVNYFSEGVDSVTVTPRKVVVGTAVTWEILKRGMGDFVKFVLQNAADAIARKLGTDICNGLSAGAASGNAVAGGIDFNAIIDAETNVNSATDGSSIPYGFMADKLVVKASEYGNLQKDTDWKNVVYRAGAKQGDLIQNMQSLKFGNLDIVVTPLFTSSGTDAMVLDSKKAAILVKESDLETFEGQINGRPYDREVVAVMSYVLAVVYSSAIANISS